MQMSFHPPASFNSYLLLEFTWHTVDCCGSYKPSSSFVAGTEQHFVDKMCVKSGLNGRNYNYSVTHLGIASHNMFVRRTQDWKMVVYAAVAPTF